ncbi:MAG: exodeoxyribonuclease VII large subunit [Alphaproteobacteria bacterium]
MNQAATGGATPSNLPEYSVSELSAALRRTVEESFSYVRVRGELSRVHRHSSGHCYFDLKDDRAVLAACVWKAQFARLRVKPEQGLEVVCTGRLTTYPGQSKYQLIVEQMELAGLGALMAMLEERKKKLAAEGLFDAERKRPIPYLPEVIGVITSPTGAVIRDILHRLADRFPRHVLLWPVSVQGERAAGDVAAAIRGFDALRAGGDIQRPDVIIVARGGGSFEDLMPFNEEIVVRAAAECTIPLISAVGHETDTTLIDFAADRRAPTPTAAAEMAVPVRAELTDNVLGLTRRLFRANARSLEQRRQKLQGLARALPRPDSLFALPQQRFDAVSARLPRALHRNVQRHAIRFRESAALLRPRLIRADIQRGRERVSILAGQLRRGFAKQIGDAHRELTELGRVLDTLSYRAVLGRGFVLVRGADGRLRRRAQSVIAGERLTLAFADGERAAVASGTPQEKPLAKLPVRARSGGQGNLF